MQSLWFTSRRGRVRLRLTVLIVSAVTTVPPGVADAVRSSAAVLESVRFEDELLELRGSMLYRWELHGGDSDREVLLTVPAAVLKAVPITGVPGLILSVTAAVAPPGAAERTDNGELIPAAKDGMVVLRIRLAEASRHQGLVTPDGRRILVRFAAREPRPEPADVAPAAFEVATLLHADAEQIADVLRRLVEFGDRVVQVDRRLNQLVIDRRSEDFERLSSLARVLDRPAGQILIDAQIVELHSDAASQLGLSISDTISLRLFERSETFGQVPLEPQPLLRTPLELYAAISMLAGDGKARVLANPRVATLDGIPAVVRTEERFPVFVTQVSGDQTYRIKQDIIAGITLSIMPRRSGESGITTRITTEVTSVTGTTADGYPTTSTREVETNIRVRSGETIVVGGLLEARELENVRRIPILGRIPLLGRLFRTVRREQKQTDLYVIVTPYIVDEEEQQ